MQNPTQQVCEVQILAHILYVKGVIKMKKCICQSKKTLLSKLHEATLELHLEQDKLIGFCGWCGCHTTIEIKYCPMCGRKLEETNERT